MKSSKKNLAVNAFAVLSIMSVSFTSSTATTSMKVNREVASLTDIRSANEGIYVKKAKVGNKEGFIIKLCAFDSEKRSYNSCNNIGLKSFYTKSELEKANEFLEFQRLGSTVGWGVVAVHASVIIGSVLLSPPTGILLAGAGAAAVTAAVVNVEEGREIKKVRKGVFSDEDISLDRENFAKILNLVQAALLNVDEK